jgi:hypothetical protein
MVDIVLSFVTIVDVEGNIVKDYAGISRHYLRTWFVPDLAGSFPFDMVIAAAAYAPTAMNPA